MKKALKNLGKDTFTYGMANMLGQILGFVLLPLYTTYLTTSDYGVISMLAFITMFFTPLSAMGMTNAIFRRYNLHKEVKQQIISLSTGSIFVLLTSVILLGIGLFFAENVSIFLVDSKDFGGLVQLVFVTSFFTSLSAVFGVVLRAERRVNQIAMIRIGGLLISIGTTIYLVVGLEYGVLGVLWGNLSGAIFATIVQFILCKKYIHLLFDIEELKALLKYGIPFLPHRLLAYGITFVGQFFIKNYIGLAEVGLYNIALKFALPLSFIIGAVQSAWVPIKFQIHREEGEGRGLIFRRLISVYFIIVAFIFIGLVTIGPELLLLMTDANFDAAVYIFPFVLLVPFAKGIYFMGATGFEYTNNTKPLPLVSGFGLLLIILIEWLTVKYTHWGILGIIVGMVIAWLGMASLIRFFATKRFYVPLDIKLILTLFAGAVLLSFFISSIQNMGFQNRLIIEISTLLVLLIGLFVLVVNNKDFQKVDLKRYPILRKLDKVLFVLKSKLRWKT